MKSRRQDIEAVEILANLVEVRRRYNDCVKDTNTIYVGALSQLQDRDIKVAATELDAMWDWAEEWYDINV